MNDPDHDDDDDDDDGFWSLDWQLDLWFDDVDEIFIRLSPRY